MARKTGSKKKSGKRAAAKARGKKSARRHMNVRRRTHKIRRSRERLPRGLEASRAEIVAESEAERSREAGQSGDLEGVSDIEEADSESVRELAEEGQDYEAEIIGGVERAGDRPERRVRTDVDEEPRPRPKRQTL